MTSSHAHDYTLVVGLGISGQAAARFCARRREPVVVTDQRAEQDLKLGPLAEELRGLGVRFELGGHDRTTFLGARRIVLSPGVPDLPEIEAARAAGVEVLGEFEMAAREIAAPILCVTGTNGKSTTTSLLGAVLEQTGRPTFTGGNLGQPLIEAAGWPADGFVVAEASSFQLDTTSRYRAHVAVLLNVTPDHLDRYPSMEAYADSKARVFLNQTAADFAVVSDEDPLCQGLARRGSGQVVTFHAAPHPALSLVGRHNEENAQAAFTAARLVGATPAQITAAARSFRPLPHRMELVGHHRGVVFVDDSKGTNVGAVVKSLEGYARGPGKVALILGGRDKGGSYEPLVPLCQQVCRVAVLIGESKDRIAAAFGDQVAVERATTLEEAVERAAAACQEGDTVLLSPACSSYDMFRDYKERGDRFRAAALALGAVAPAGAGAGEGHP